MSETAVATVRRSPAWDNRHVKTFMNNMKQNFGDGTPWEALFDPRGVLIPGVRYRGPRSLLDDHFHLVDRAIADWSRVSPDKYSDHVYPMWPHYSLRRPPAIDAGTFRDPDVADVWEAQRLALWKECPLLCPDMGEAFVHRWRIAGSAVGIVEYGNSSRLAIGMQVHLVPPNEGPAALARGAGYVLVCAAWALAATWWQCGTRVGIALLNTSFTRLAIVDDVDGTHVLVVERAGATPDADADAHADVSQLAETHSLAHDFFPRGQLDRDAFGLYWDALARGYLVALRWTRETRQVVQQARAEMDAEDAEARDDSGMENGADENGYDDDGDDDDDNSDDSDDSDDYEPHSVASSASSIISDRRFDYNAAYYDDVPLLTASLARMFPRYRVVSPAEMTALVERALPTEPPGGPLDDVELPSI